MDYVNYQLNNKSYRDWMDQYQERALEAKNSQVYAQLQNARDLQAQKFQQQMELTGYGSASAQSGNLQRETGTNTSVAPTSSGSAIPPPASYASNFIPSMTISSRGGLGTSRGYVPQNTSTGSLSRKVGTDLAATLSTPNATNQIVTPSSSKVNSQVPQNSEQKPNNLSGPQPLNPAELNRSDSQEDNSFGQEIEMSPIPRGMNAPAMSSSSSGNKIISTIAQNPEILETLM